MKREELCKCQFHSWYDSFRKSKKRGIEMNSTPRSTMIRLQPKFLEYLQSDGIRLPRCATHVSSWTNSNFANEIDDNWGEVEDDEVDNNWFFPELTEAVAGAIADLGGSAFPKLNWSSPKDAVWINGDRGLKCFTPGDVYLLLKSSDFIVHDLSTRREVMSGTSSENNQEYYLVLRQWCHIHRSMEFRCFVKSRVMVAISQRDHTQHYPHLVQEQMSICEKIQIFLDDIVIPKFSLKTFVFDCYIDKDDKVWLIDFNVWGEWTDSLLFEWEELNAMGNSDSVDGTGYGSENLSNDHGGTMEVELRLVTQDKQVRNDPLASYRAPIETINFMENGFQSFEEFQRNCKTGYSESDSDDDTEKSL